MHRSGFVISAIALAVIGVGGLHAQALPDSLLHHRIRIELARQDRSIEGHVPRQVLRGVLTGVSPDSVTLRLHPGASPVTVSMTGIHQIHLSRGVSRSRTAMSHALLGATYVGTLASLGAFDASGRSTADHLIWAGSGLVAGAVLGALLPQEHWKRVFRR